MERSHDLHAKPLEVTLFSRPSTMCVGPPLPVPINRPYHPCTDLDRRRGAWWCVFRDEFSWLVVGDAGQIPLGGNNCSTDLWIRRDAAHGLLRRQISLADPPNHWEYPFLYTEQIQLSYANLCLPSSSCRPSSNRIPHPMTEPRGIETSRCCVISPGECWSRSRDFTREESSIPVLCGLVLIATYAVAGQFSLLG